MALTPATGEAYTGGPASPAYTLGWGYDGTGWYYRTGEADFIIGDFLTDGVNTYYMDNTGHMVTGWQNIKGFKYYFYTEADTNNTTGAPTGSMAKSQTIDNIELDANGKAKMNGTSDEAIAAVQATGGTLSGAYNYAASLKYRRFTADPNSGTRYFAHLGFSMGNGNCYVMAAVFCEMARALGYEVRQMAGSVPLRRGGMGPHSWCEVNIDGTWRVFDPNSQTKPDATATTSTTESQARGVTPAIVRCTTDIKSKTATQVTMKLTEPSALSASSPPAWRPLYR